jgi:hypothetical protein
MIKARRNISLRRHMLNRHPGESRDPCVRQLDIGRMDPDFRRDDDKWDGPQVSVSPQRGAEADRSDG